MTVITSGKLDNLVPLGGSPRQPYTRHRRLRPTAAKTHFFYARNRTTNFRRQHHLALMRRPVTHSSVSRFSHRLHNFRVGMTQNSWPPTSDIIHILPPIHIPQHGTPGRLYKKRLSPHRPKRSDRRMYAPWSDLLGPLKEFVRSNSCALNHPPRIDAESSSFQLGSA